MKTEILTLDVYSCNFTYKDKSYDAEFQINWDCDFGEAEITSIVRDGMELVDYFDYEAVEELQFAIEEYGDNSQWCEDRASDLMDEAVHIVEASLGY